MNLFTNDKLKLEIANMAYNNATEEEVRNEFINCYLTILSRMDGSLNNIKESFESEKEKQLKDIEDKTYLVELIAEHRTEQADIEELMVMFSECQEEKLFNYSKEELETIAKDLNIA